MAFRNLPEMPCGPILELHGQRKRFHVPYGLKRLIEDMTREVLRYQPPNIYEFLAVFMESRLQKRLQEEEKNEKRKSWQQHRWSWQGGSVLEPHELKEFLEQLPAPEEEINHHAVVIQAAFRGYQARKMAKEIRKTTHLDDEKRKSQETSGLGGDKGSSDQEKTGQDEDDKKQRLKSWLEKHSNRKSSVLDPEELKEFIETLDAPEEVVNHHAVVIQAAFRGYQARKMAKEIRKTTHLDDEKSLVSGLGGDKTQGGEGKTGQDENPNDEKTGQDENTNGDRTEQDENTNGEKMGQDENTNAERTEQDENTNGEKLGQDENPNSEKMGQDENTNGERTGQDENTNGEKTGQDENTTRETAGQDENPNGEKTGQNENPNEENVN